MAATKRSQNKCNSCRYTWYPKGKDLSRECPSCKSKDVKIVGPGLGSILSGVGVIVVAIIIFGGNKNATDKTPTPTSTEQPATSSIEPAAKKTVPEAIPVSREDVSVAAEKKEIAQTVSPQAENERVVSEEELTQMKAENALRVQLLQACSMVKGTDNIKTCLVEECSQPEYGRLQECQK